MCLLTIRHVYYTIYKNRFFYGCQIISLVLNHSKWCEIVCCVTPKFSLRLARIYAQLCLQVHVFLRFRPSSTFFVFDFRSIVPELMTLPYEINALQLKCSSNKSNNFICNLLVAPPFGKRRLHVLIYFINMFIIMQSILLH